MTDDDAAIRQLESLAASLQLLGADTQRELSAELRSLARAELEAGFIEQLPEALGLAS